MVKSEAESRGGMKHGGTVARRMYIYFMVLSTKNK